MRKRLKKKLQKNSYKSHWGNMLYKYQEELIKLYKSHGLKIDFTLKQKSKSFLFMDKGIPGGDKTTIIRCRLAGKNFNTIIIDDVI